MLLGDIVFDPIISYVFLLGARILWFFWEQRAKGRWGFL